MEKPVILTIDDDPQVLRSVARDLRQRDGQDYRMLRAASGAEALQQLPAQEQPVALLLSDQRMPGMSGVAFLGEARPLALMSTRVLLTAYAATQAAIDASTGRRWTTTCSSRGTRSRSGSIPCSTCRQI